MLAGWAQLRDSVASHVVDDGRVLRALVDVPRFGEPAKIYVE